MQPQIQSQGQGQGQGQAKDPVYGIYSQAEGYFQSAHVLRAHAKDFFAFHPQFLFPATVLEAFSLELSLKALLMIEGGSYPPTHNLEELFKLLTIENQLTIKTRTEQAFAQMNNIMQAIHNKESKPGDPPQPKVDFDYALHASRLAFEAFRYVHEAQNPNTDMSRFNWLGEPIMQQVRRRVGELRPAFQNVNFHSAPPPPLPSVAPSQQSTSPAP